MTTHHPDTSTVPSENELQVLMAEAGGKSGLLAAQRQGIPPRLAHAHDNSKAVGGNMRGEMKVSKAEDASGAVAGLMKEREEAMRSERAAVGAHTSRRLEKETGQVG